MASPTHTQGALFCFGSNERTWTYVLGRKYSSFQGTIGLSGNSVSTAKIRFDILADGRLVYSKDLQVGQSAALNVPVSNVLHLELDTTLLTQDGGCGAATGKWANIHAVAHERTTTQSVRTIKARQLALGGESAFRPGLVLGSPWPRRM